MVNTCDVLRSAGCPSGRQQSIRRRARHWSLSKAVCRAADAFFCFRYRAIREKALWSDSEHVWLGRETFLHWALWDAGIDIPWVVANSIDAPLAAGELRVAVAAELAAYWGKQLTSLARTEKPYWLPLP